jgi:dipeptidyl-peptidase-4
LGFVRAFEWNADGTSLAFLRFDETEVPEYTMAHYGDELYPETITFKYPKPAKKTQL